MKTPNNGMQPTRKKPRASDAERASTQTIDERSAEEHKEMRDRATNGPRHYIAYGGGVSWADFVLFPLPVLIAGLPLFIPGPSWLATAALVFAGWGVLVMAVISTSAFNAREWVTGARIQWPLILCCFFLGEVLWFASLYWLISRASSGAFSQTIDRVGALYFSFSTITTTGFGDIIATSHGGRLAVSAEMACSILTIVVFIATATTKAFEEFEPPKITVLDDQEDARCEASRNQDSL